mgnify:CR=1 FL=1
MPHPEVVAAGTVVLRGRGSGRRVLVVHRPRYNDWSLPKGKQQPGELLQVTAVRETLEETGVRVRLSTPLSRVTYMVPKGRKDVHWWLGRVIGDQPADPGPLDGGEVDEATWLSLAQAHSQLSYADEIELLDRALRRRSAGTVVVVRHAKAMARKNWSGNDALRPLTDRGRHQAERLSGLLGSYGVGAVVSSPATRCVQTLQPYAEDYGLPLQTVPLLSEEQGATHEEEVAELMWQLRTAAITRPRTPTVICGHRPVLPAMFRGLHVDPVVLSPAQCLVIHLDADSDPLAIESLKSPC